MALPLIPDPRRVPAHIMFPEQYRESRSMIVKDFVAYGVTIVVGLVAFAVYFS